MISIYDKGCLDLLTYSKITDIEYKTLMERIRTNKMNAYSSGGITYVFLKPNFVYLNTMAKYENTPHPKIKLGFVMMEKYTDNRYKDEKELLQKGFNLDIGRFNDFLEKIVNIQQFQQDGAMIWIYYFINSNNPNIFITYLQYCDHQKIVILKKYIDRFCEPLVKNRRDVVNKEIENIFTQNYQRDIYFSIPGESVLGTEEKGKYISKVSISGNFSI